LISLEQWFPTGGSRPKVSQKFAEGLDFYNCTYYHCVTFKQNPNTHRFKLFLELQGDSHSQISRLSWDFVWKRQNWHRNINLGNIAVFEKLCSVIDKSVSGLDQLLNNEISRQTETLLENVQRYFPEPIVANQLL